MMSRWIFLNLLVLFGWAQWGWSQEIQVVTEEFVPYNYTDENGRVTGYSTEVVEAVLTQAKLAYTIKIYPWARAYHMALRDSNTLIYTMGRNTEREQLFKWVGPIAPRNLWLFKLKNRPDIHIQTLEDAKQYLVGVVRNDASTQFLESHGFEDPKNLATVTNDEQNQRKLLMGRVDLIMGNELTVAMQMKQTNLPFDALEKVLLLVDDFYWMAFSLGTSDLVIEQTQSALEMLTQEKRLDEIFRKYVK